jgi:AsmA protein
VVGSLKGQDGRDMNELRGLTVPVKLSGPFEKLSYTVDWGAVAQDALKSKVAEQAKDKLAPQVQEQRKKVEERARDALKGLLGR